ncbi:hypothetical protein ACWEH1_10100 [Micromonospora chersina]
MDGTGQREGIRPGRRRFWLLGAGTVLVFVLVSLLVGLLAEGFAASWWRRGDPPGWLEVTGLVLVVLGLVLEIAALVGIVRSGSHRADRESRLWAVSWRRRRELARSVRRDVVDSPDDLALLRATAAQMARQRWLLPLLGGLVALNVGQGLLSFAPIWIFLIGFTAVMFAVACRQVPRDARRGEAFLRAHPVDSPVTDLM